MSVFHGPLSVAKDKVQKNDKNSTDTINSTNLFDKELMLWPFYQ